MKAIRLGWTLRSCAVATLWVCSALAAQHPSALGDLARQVRAQKKQAPKAAHVWDNDNLPSGPGTAVNVVGSVPQAAPAPAEAEATAPSPAASTTEAQNKEKERAETEAELNQDKELLAKTKKDLDLLQREYNLERQQHYSNPQYASDTKGKAGLDALIAQIDAKRQEVLQTEQKIADLQERLENLNRELGPKKEGPLTLEQQRESWVARMVPLQQELHQVDAQIQRMRTGAAAQGLTLYGVTAGGSMTAELLQQLERRQLELQQRIADTEDAARRAGVPAAWVR